MLILVQIRLSIGKKPTRRTTQEKSLARLELPHVLQIYFFQKLINRGEYNLMIKKGLNQISNSILSTMSIYDIFTLEMKCQLNVTQFHRDNRSLCRRNMSKHSHFNILSIRMCFFLQFLVVRLLYSTKYLSVCNNEKVVLWKLYNF